MVGYALRLYASLPHYSFHVFPFLSIFFRYRLTIVLITLFSHVMFDVKLQIVRCPHLSQIVQHNETCRRRCIGQSVVRCISITEIHRQINECILCLQYALLSCICVFRSYCLLALHLTATEMILLFFLSFSTFLFPFFAVSLWHLRTTGGRTVRIR